MTGGRDLPMFPLGTVLLPGSILPLHVFEPRYRRLVADVLEGDRRFGVVLIERGSEVGGGDQRSDVGTVAEILRARPTADGRWGLLAIGGARLAVEEWLPDAPYPLARVAPLVDDPAAPAVTVADQAQLRPQLHHVLALLVEIGASVPDLTPDLPDDPDEALWHLTAGAGLATFDLQRVLRLRSGAARVELVRQLLDDHAALLEARLASGG